MKNYRWHLRNAEGKTISTAYSLNTARQWLRVKHVDESVWDGHSEKRIVSIAPDLKTIEYNDGFVSVSVGVDCFGRAGTWRHG